MSWREINRDSIHDLFEAYQHKYGVKSDYQNFQKQIYSHLEIKSAFIKIVQSLKIKPSSVILDIGINNGYEIELLSKILPDQPIVEAQIIGFDLANDALEQAEKSLISLKNLKLVKGNISDFKDTDILTGKGTESFDDSIDIVLALTSLQSSSLQQDFDSFLENLSKKLHRKAQILVGVPNLHVDADNNLSPGLFNAKTRQVDTDFANIFSKKMSYLFSKHEFRCIKEGGLISFHLFSR